MNVYTHVAMADLHDDVESLAGLKDSGGTEPGPAAANVACDDAPDQLAKLISSWGDLPHNVRSPISSLASE